MLHLQDLDIAITPHLDDGLEYGGWRNGLVFDPLTKYGGYSYYEVRPVCSAEPAGLCCTVQCQHTPHCLNIDCLLHTLFALRR